MGSSSALWTSQASEQKNIDKRYAVNVRKLEGLQRQFDKEGHSMESRVPVEIQIQDRNKNSVVS
jgi:hypothetical protein